MSFTDAFFTYPLEANLEFFAVVGFVAVVVLVVVVYNRRKKIGHWAEKHFEKFYKRSGK